MWTTYSTGNIAAGEGEVVCRTTETTPVRYPVIYVHGAAEVGHGWMNISTRWPILTAVADAGYVITCPDLGGPQTWGSPTSQARISSAYNYVQTDPKVKKGKVILLCQSMGALNSYIWARNNPTKVAGICSLIGVVNLTDVYQNDSSIANVVNIAHGTTYSEVSLGSTLNPLTMARNKVLPDVPAQVWYGTDDVLCKPQFAAEFISLTGATGIAVPGGHAETTLIGVTPSTVVSFLNSII